MNQVHPAFADTLRWMQGLAPVVPLRLKPINKIPRTPRGQVLYERVTDKTLVCHLRIEPAETGDRERGTGLQLSPDYPAQAQLLAAYTANGANIVGLLRPSEVLAIEQNCIDSGDFS